MPRKGTASHEGSGDETKRTRRGRSVPDSAADMADAPSSTHSAESTSPLTTHNSQLTTVAAETALRRDVATLRRLATAVGAEAVQDALAALEERLDARTLTVLVLGEFNRGKSALINSLLGESILPMGTAPTTRTLTEVRYGAEERIEAHYADGVRQPLDRAAYAALAGQGPPAAGREGDGGVAVQAAPPDTEGALDRVVISLPHPLLRHLTFLDTPGLNDPDNVQAEIIYGLLPRCDAALFVLDSSFALSLSERAIIGDKLLRSSLGRLVFVLNKADQLGGADEEAQILQRASALLEPLLGGPPLLLPYSARAALRGDRGGRNEALDHLIAQELPAAQAALLLASARAKVAEAARSLAEVLTFQQQRLTASLAELDAELSGLGAREEATRAGVEVVLAGLAQRLDALRDDYVAGLRGLANSLSAGLPDDMRALELDEVRRHLPFYIHDTFRWHLEETLPVLRGAVDAACAEAAGELEALLPEVRGPAWGSLEGPAEGGAYPLGRRAAPDLWDQGLVLSMFVGAVGLVLNPLLASALLIGGPVLRLFSLKARQSQEREALVEDARKAIVATADAVSGSVREAFRALEAEIRAHAGAALAAQEATVRAALEDVRARRAAGASDSAVRGQEIAAHLATLARVASSEL